MIQVTVRIVQRSTRNSNSQMLVNEKNSMESNARLCTKTLAVVYFKKGLIPIVLKEGIRLSGLSRGVNKRSKEGRMYLRTEDLRRMIIESSGLRRSKGLMIIRV